MDNTNRFQNPLEVHGVQEILDDGISVDDINAKDLLHLMLIELKKIELHLSLMNEAELTNKDVGE